MEVNHVKLSIGLPVYNGAEFLEHTLDSLLNQTFKNFELIISDNGSDDDTESICRRRAAEDPRIRYIRHHINRGATFNWNYVVQEATGEYFKWASANDYYDPMFLACCIDVLDSKPDVVLCYSRTCMVSELGEFIRIDSADFDVPDKTPTKRFARLMGNMSRNNAQSGVIRLADLRQTRLERSYPHGDKVLMAELGLRGKYWLISEPLFNRRWGNRSSSVHAMDRKSLANFLDPKRSTPDLYLWTKQFDFFRSGLTFQQPMAGRIRLIFEVLRASARRRAELWRELKSFLVRKYKSGNTSRNSVGDH